MSVTQSYKTVTIPANLVAALQVVLHARIEFFNTSGLSPSYVGLLAESRDLLAALDAPSAPAPAIHVLSAESIEQIDLALLDRREMISAKIYADPSNDYWQAAMSATVLAIDEVVK